ncbi:MAG: hypothetical protein ACR2KP_12100, partial [Egibacteraceae bacterium]
MSAIDAGALPKRAIVLCAIVMCTALATAALATTTDSSATLLLVGAALAALGAMTVYVLGPTRALPEASTHLFVFLIYTNVLVIASTFHGVPASVLSFSYLLLAVPFVTYAFSRREPIVLPRAFPFVVLYLAALCLSAAFAVDTGDASRPIWNFVTEGLLLYLLVSNTVRSPAALRRVLWVLIAGAALLSFLSVWQELTNSYDNILGGLTQTNVGDLRVGENLDGKVMRDRLAGPLGSPNRYAQILAVVVPIAMMRVLGE